MCAPNGAAFAVGAGGDTGSRGHPRAAGGSSNVGLTFYFWRDMLLPNKAREIVFLLDISSFS